MPHVQITRRDKIVTKIAILVLLAGGSMWFGEKYEPFGLTDRVASYAAKQIEAKASRVAAQSDKKKDKQTAPKPQPTPGKTYIVQGKKDTVYSISRRFGVKEMKLKWANHIGEDNLIIAGQELIIPNGS